MAANNDRCRVCGGTAQYLWKSALLDLASVRYFECDVCGYVQTEYPYWLERAYSEAINVSDTGIMSRNLANSKIVLATLLSFGKLDGQVVDYAGGYGILVRLLRDQGIDALWSDRYSPNLLARGFEYDKGGATLLTAFEAFEHFVNPAEELDNMLTISPNILLSTELIRGSTPAQDKWWYYGKEHGQHIGFFRMQTLEYLAQKHGKQLTSNGHSCHLISDIPVNSFGWRGLLKVKKHLPSLLKVTIKVKNLAGSPDHVKTNPITTQFNSNIAWKQKMKRILVTGGAGFLGSHLCERLLNEGNEVICVDNFFTGRKKNIANIASNPYFEIIRHDVTFPLYVEVDQIYNLACPASPVHYQHDPVQTTKTSVHGAINMLGLAKRLNARILQASTSEVYGDPEIHPQPESYWGKVNPIGIRSCYDEGKRCAETLFFDYHRQHQLDIKVVRIFNTYGPRMHPNDGRVVSNFIVQALKGEKITIYGEGLQTRSFCYVDDLIEALLRMMNTPAGFTGPINIGNPEEFTMLELAEKIIALTGSSSQLFFCPLPSDDPKQRQPDITLAKKELDWQPSVNLENGLQRTIAYFQKLLSEK